MVFTWKIFTDLVEKEMTILISSERHEIAERLRILASHAPADAELVNDLLGLYPGEYVDGYDPCNVQHLADLIEPKGRTCRWKHIEGTWFISECGKKYDCIISANFCPNCGAKVIE